MKRRRILPILMTAMLSLSCLNVSAENSLDMDDPYVISMVQTALTELGYDCGVPDGVAGSKTTEAIKAYQEANNLDATGVLDEDLIIMIADAVEAADFSVSEDVSSSNDAAASDDFQSAATDDVSVAEAVDGVVMDEEGCKIVVKGINKEDQTIELDLSGLDVSNYTASVILSIDGIMFAGVLEEHANETSGSNYTVAPTPASFIMVSP